MAEYLSGKISVRLSAILHARLFSQVGNASNHDFTSLCSAFKSFRIVPARNIALFEQGSRIWASSIFSMQNDIFNEFKSMKDKRLVEDFIFETQSDFIALLDNYTNQYGTDDDLFNKTSLQSVFLGYAREVFVASMGYKIDCAFDDLLKIYQKGFIPCGFDGIFPYGELLIF